MREDFLYYLWQFQRFKPGKLFTVCGKPMEILNPGERNNGSGPDFSNGTVLIDNQTWVGNIEIHTRAAAWYSHGHDNDPNYSNVILHVVWEHDSDVQGPDGVIIPTFCIKEYVSSDLLQFYHQNFLEHSASFIPCQNVIGEISADLYTHWLSRMYIEKLETAYQLIHPLALKVNHNWEHLLFLLLFKSFGENVNGRTFLSIAERIPFKAVIKLKGQPQLLESVFMGMGGLLEKYVQDDFYYFKLRKDFRYFRYKFQMPHPVKVKPEFFKLRPANFPTIRLAQLASLYSANTSLFRTLILFNSKEDIYPTLQVSTSRYWESHYTFGRKSRRFAKKVSRKFSEKIFINTIVPLRCYYKMQNGKDNLQSESEMVSSIPPEKNNIVNKFKSLGLRIPNAVISQGVLHLYKNYCIKNRCLQCAIGHRVLKGK